MLQQVTEQTLGLRVEQVERLHGADHLVLVGPRHDRIATDAEQGPHPPLSRLQDLVGQRRGGHLSDHLAEPAHARARARAEERVLTNPMSSAALALISPYLRGELSGRPLSGQYSLVLHGSSAIDWTRLRGVQLLLQYRYWTRQR